QLLQDSDPDERHSRKDRRALARDDAEDRGSLRLRALGPPRLRAASRRARPGLLSPGFGKEKGPALAPALSILRVADLLVAEHGIGGGRAALEPGIELTRCQQPAFLVVEDELVGHIGDLDRRMRG